MIERSLLTNSPYNCGARQCPGHPELTITKRGAWLADVVRNLSRLPAL
jgi:hypothetical protein